MMKKFFYRALCGFFLGLSVFAPGFSGSVIAIIMGIYQDLVRIASNPFKRLKENILFCLPLAVGAAVSAVVLVIGLNYLFENYEKATFLLFAGLIAGNLPIIYAEVKKIGFKKHFLIGGVVAFAAALALSVFAMGMKETEATGLSASLPVLAIGGFAGGAAVLMPGMSVSMVLLIAGIYNQLMATAKDIMKLDFNYLFPFAFFGLCAVAGLVITSKGIKTVFEKFPGFANTAVLGFMSGSLVGIVVQTIRMDDVNESFSWWLGGLMLAAGLGVSMLFVVLGKVMDKE